MEMEPYYQNSKNIILVMERSVVSQLFYQSIRDIGRVRDGRCKSYGDLLGFGSKSYRDGPAIFSILRWKEHHTCE